MLSREAVYASEPSSGLRFVIVLPIENLFKKPTDSHAGPNRGTRPNRTIKPMLSRYAIAEFSTPLSIMLLNIWEISDPRRGGWGGGAKVIVMDKSELDGSSSAGAKVASISSVNTMSFPSKMTAMKPALHRQRVRCTRDEHQNEKMDVVRRR